MSKPNEEDRVQKLPPPTPRNHFTSDAPSTPDRSRRRFPWLTAGPILFGVLAVAALIAAYKTDFFRYGLCGYPTTPMTVAKADQIASGGPPPGSSLEELEAWLPSQGITSNPKTPGPYYYIARPHKDDDSPKQWMNVKGDKTVAECAGLKVSDVHSYVGVMYPEADRRLIGIDTITIYFFFGADNRLIKYWVERGGIYL